MILSWSVGILATLVLVQWLQLRQRRRVDRLQLDLEVEHELRRTGDRERDNLRGRLEAAYAKSAVDLEELAAERKEIAQLRVVLANLQAELREVFCRLFDALQERDKLGRQVLECQAGVSSYAESLLSVRDEVTEAATYLAKLSCETERVVVSMESAQLEPTVGSGQFD